MFRRRRKWWLLRGGYLYYPFNCMKHFLIHLSVLFLLAGGALAQETIDKDRLPLAELLGKYMEQGMEVPGLKMPYYDEDGALRAQLYCGMTKFVEGDVFDLTNLRVDVYEDGKLFVTVFSPHCFLKLKEEETGIVLVVYSEDEVLVDSEQMIMSGKGFRFTSEENKIEIFNGSKVLVKKSARDMVQEGDL